MVYSVTEKSKKRICSPYNCLHEEKIRLHRVALPTARVPMETASVVLSGTEPVRELHRDTYDKYVTKDEDRCERGVSGVWRLAFGVWRLAFGVWRLAFGTDREKGRTIASPF